MNKTTFSHTGIVIAAVIVLAVMVAFATPFGDYVADSTEEMIYTFSAKSDDRLFVVGDAQFHFDKLLSSTETSFETGCSVLPPLYG